MSRKRVAILGSTGSIGKNAIKVLRNLQSDFEIVALTANSNFQLLAEQANEFHVKNLVLANKDAAEKLRSLVASDVKVYCSEKATALPCGTTLIDLIIIASAPTFSASLKILR